MLVKRALHDGKFSDKFSDITKTTDDSASMMSDEVSDVTPDLRQQSDRSAREGRKFPELLKVFIVADGKRASYLHKGKNF